MRPALGRTLAALSLGLVLALAPTLARAGGDSEKEQRFLKNIRQLTTGKEGERGGEPYFSPDGKQVIFQSTRHGTSYDQIYVVSVEGGEPRLLSTGKGKTTCSYFHPTDPDKFIFAFDASRRTNLAGSAARGPEQAPELQVGLQRLVRHLRGLAQDGDDHAAPDRDPGLRRRGQLLARRHEDLLHLGARGRQRDLRHGRGREEREADRSRPSSDARQEPAPARGRRTVLHAGRQGSPLPRAKGRRPAGAHARLHRHARRQDAPAHSRAAHELVPLPAPRREEGRLRRGSRRAPQLRAVPPQDGRLVEGSPPDVERRLRRAPVVLARRQEARLDVHAARRAVPGLRRRLRGPARGRLRGPVRAAGKADSRRPARDPARR